MLLIMLGFISPFHVNILDLGRPISVLPFVLYIFYDHGVFILDLYIVMEPALANIGAPFLPNKPALAVDIYIFVLLED